ncbi:MAG: DUF5684 domain-containing protein [Chloroflexi bacterium]|nr:DUF5684 domain-containing protein [Chloroflexota bacterium]
MPYSTPVPAWITVLVIVTYLINCFFIMQIGRRVRCPLPGWTAFVPVVNIYYMVRMSDYPWWYFLLMFIPLVNIIVLVMIWVNILKKLRHHWIWIILLIIPIVQIIAFAILAFVEDADDHPDPPFN